MGLRLSCFKQPAFYVIRARHDFLELAAREAGAHVAASLARAVWSGALGGLTRDVDEQERTIRARAKRVFLRNLAHEADGAAWLDRLFPGDRESEQAFDERFELEILLASDAIDEIEHALPDLP